MAKLTILYWRDIPTQVIIKSDQGAAKRELDGRFLQAVDMAAMRGGAHSADDYLADWRHGPAEACGDDLEAEADAAVTRLEEAYDKDRLKALIDAGGRENDG